MCVGRNLPQQQVGSIHIDPHAKIKIQLRLSTDHRDQVKNRIKR